MRAGQLKKLLLKYPPNMRLNIVVENRTVIETTTGDMTMRLLGAQPDFPGGPTLPPDQDPDQLLMTFCGHSDLILRERVECSHNFAGTMVLNQWLEMDLQ